MSIVIARCYTLVRDSIGMRIYFVLDCNKIFKLEIFAKRIYRVKADKYFT